MVFAIYPAWHSRHGSPSTGAPHHEPNSSHHPTGSRQVRLRHHPDAREAQGRGSLHTQVARARHSHREGLPRCATPRSHHQVTGHRHLNRM